MKINYWEKLEPQAVYHIYNRAVGNENLFIEDGNYSYFLAQWKKYLPYLDVYAFCLMPNHFHFLARVKNLSDELRTHVKQQGTVKSQQFLNDKISYSSYLEDQFKRLFSSYALAINRQQGRHGSLFQKRFKRISVKSENKLLYLLLYIHHNPVHHNFCKDLKEWKYSSWAAFQNLRNPSQVNRSAVLNWFDDDIDKAMELFTKYHEDFRIEKKMEKEALDC